MLVCFYMSILIITTPLLFFAWVVLCPHQALTLIVEFKRRWRLYIIQSAGKRGAQELARRLHAWALQNGIDPDLVNQMLNGKNSEIVYRLGIRQANLRLGEPTLFERTF